MRTKITGFPAAQCGQGSLRVPPGTEPLAGQLGREEECVYTPLPPHTQPKKPCRVCLLSPSASPYNISKHLCVSIELQKSTLTSSADMLFSSLTLVHSPSHTCSNMNGDEGWYLSSLSLLRSPADVHTARLTKHLEKHHKHIYKWWHARRPDSLHRAKTTKKQTSHNFTNRVESHCVNYLKRYLHLIDRESSIYDTSIMVIVINKSPNKRSLYQSCGFVEIPHQQLSISNRSIVQSYIIH